MRSLKHPVSMAMLALVSALALTPRAVLHAAFRKHVSLQVVLPDGKPGPELPLEEVAARGTVTGSVAQLELTHVFGNPSKEPVEAIYSFPLPHEAAVTAMRMEIGERVIRAVIQEREEARKTYEQAKSAGKTAALLEQHQPNVFTQLVANVLPGQRVRVVLTYVHAIERSEGSYELGIPTTIASRYVGGDGKVDGGEEARAIVQAPSRGAAAPASRLIIELMVNAGLAISTLESRTHPLERRGEDLAAGRVTVALAGSHIPDRDFILRWTTSGGEPRMAVRAHRDAGDGTFMVHLEPPWPPAPRWTAARELIFVVDCSGSQQGQPLEASKAAILRALDGARENDTLQVVRFDQQTSSFAPAPVPATPANVAKIRTHVGALATGGGTELVPALDASLGLAPDRERVRIVAFFTDGLIGDNRGVMLEVQKQIGSARLFTFGVGSSTNRFIIDHMARLGRGVAEYVLPGEDQGPVIERFLRRIDRQVVTAVTLRVEGGAVADVGPEPVPDVIGARPTVLLGRYRQPGKATFIMNGRVGGREWEQRLTVVLPERDVASAVLPLLWARQRIDHLLNGDPSQENHDAVRSPVTRLGLEFALVTPFTSFVAVEERRVVESGGVVKTVRIPAIAPHAMAHAGSTGGAAPEPAEWALFLVSASLLAGLMHRQQRDPGAQRPR